MTASLRLVDDEQRPHVSRLVVRTAEPCTPISSSDTRKIASSRYQATSASVTRKGLVRLVLRCSMPHVMDARQIGTGGRAHVGLDHGPMIPND